MARPAHTRADARPRIHLWDDGTWSRGATGLRHRAENVAHAVEWALQEIGHQPAVIIFEGKA